MAKKYQLFFWVAGFALFLVGSFFAYQFLVPGHRPEPLVLIDEDAEVGRVPDGSVPGGSQEPAGSADTTSSVDDGIGGTAGSNAGTEEKRTAAPDFMVEDQDGNEVQFAHMTGKPMVLNFWASWCQPCRSEMPGFDRVYQELGDQVTFMMVDLVGGQESQAAGAAYIKEQGFSFPVFYDVGQEAAYVYGISSIPTTVFIDSEGYMVAAAQGAIDEETLRYGISLVLP